ncbi:hypothetical protein COLO4_24469 [Corchorus olitorius]|uniref:Uncharacterized protein n=1 Tax=Corchorus olitorius TaxID=93759 RepID=A0A1R3I9Z4_9ROSI|nr:hypothetical protein COLO4_24469 [Corchorus olitorius]
MNLKVTGSSCFVVLFANLALLSSEIALDRLDLHSDNSTSSPPTRESSRGIRLNPRYVSPLTLSLSLIDVFFYLTLLTAISAKTEQTHLLLWEEGKKRLDLLIVFGVN